MDSSRHLFARPRDILLGGMIGIPGLMMFGRYNNTTAQPFIATYRLEPTRLLICFLVKGRQLYRVGEQDYRLRGGDVLVVFPNDLYSTAGTPQEKGVLYWFHLEIPPPDTSFFGLSAEQAGSLVRALLRIRPRHFRGSAEMKHLCDDIYLTYHRPWSPLQTARITNRLTAILFQLLDCSHVASGPGDSHRLRNVITHIEEHLAEPLSIPSLAARAGLSVSRFKAHFKEEFGIPPGEYVLRAKVEEAKRRLLSGDSSVTATAFALGFSTSQYFATVFKRYTGQRPSALVKQSHTR